MLDDRASGVSAAFGNNKVLDKVPTKAPEPIKKAEPVVSGGPPAKEAAP